MIHRNPHFLEIRKAIIIKDKIVIVFVTIICSSGWEKVECTCSSFVSSFLESFSAWKAVPDMLCFLGISWGQAWLKLRLQQWDFNPSWFGCEEFGKAIGDCSQAYNLDEIKFNEPTIWLDQNFHIKHPSSSKVRIFIF